MDFMEKYPDIAKGFTKRDKPTVDSLWQQLAASLNGAGPPQKDASGWKKIWTEWKSEIKKKMAHNKVEGLGTGGGPFSKYTLTPTEEAIVRLCGMKHSVEGEVGISLGHSVEVVPDTMRQHVEYAPGISFSNSLEIGTVLSLEQNENTCCEIDEEMPSTSKRKAEFSLPDKNPKTVRLKSTAERLKQFLDEDNSRKIETNDKLDQPVELGKENASNLRSLYRATESVAKAVTEVKCEFVSAHNRILATMQEKNELKRKQLDLELLKFSFEKERQEKK